MAPPRDPMNPDSAVRWLQMTSGLFDTGFTGLTAEKLGSVGSASIISDTAEGILASLGNGEGLTEDFDLDSSFNEVFTDLTTLVKEDNLDAETFDSVEATVLPLEAPAVSSSDTVAKKPKKRRASSVMVASTLLSDHSSYATKKPRVDMPCEENDDVVEVCNSEEKYRKRRQKNNVASKKSRYNRKQKFIQMEEQANQLESENQILREKVAELEKLTKEMKDTLVKKLAQGGK